MNSKSLPSTITSYDLLKTFAVIIMIVDHIGWYFFPEQLWWRSVGRIGFPIWFFLVGHASGRDLPPRLLWGAGILTFGNVLAGMPVFPLNALVTIALIRVLIDKIMHAALERQIYLWLISIVLMMITIPTGQLSEYGTMGLITAMFGYMVRHREQINNDNLIINFMIFALMVFVILQQLAYGFSMQQFMFMAMGTAVVRFTLLYFKKDSYPKLTAKMPSPFTWLIQLCGRHTLEIYVVHLMAFKFIAVMLGLEGFGLLQWSWMEPIW